LYWNRNVVSLQFQRSWQQFSCLSDQVEQLNPY